MNIAVRHRGAAPVGHISELGPVEAGAVLYLRLWCDDAQSKGALVRQDLSTALGPTEGQKAYSSFDQLCDLCTRHARRPLLRHAVSCKCLGADESCFANFIGYASEGEHEDALLIATTMVSPNIAPTLVGLACDFGIALRRMALRANQISYPSQAIH